MPINDLCIFVESLPKGFLFKHKITTAPVHLLLENIHKQQGFVDLVDQIQENFFAVLLNGMVQIII